MLPDPHNRQVKRSTLIRRLPAPEDRARRTSIVLTQRDQQILMDVYTHGFLTTQLIELAHFPPALLGRRSPSSCAYDRLTDLWRWGFLDRVERPVTRSLGGRQPLLYTLGAQGVPVVARALDSTPTLVQRRRLDRRNDFFVEHDLTAAAFWAHAQALLRRTRGVTLAWTAERELRACHRRVRDARTGHWLPVLPDAYLEFRYPDAEQSVQCSLLEIDMGTLTLARFQRKLVAFEEYLAQGLFHQDWRHEEFEVLVLTDSAARLEHLVQAARQVVPEDRWAYYYFATFAMLNPEQFAGEVWQDLQGDYWGLLYSRAFAGADADDENEAGAADEEGEA